MDKGIPSKKSNISITLKDKEAFSKTSGNKGKDPKKQENCNLEEPHPLIPELSSEKRKSGSRNRSLIGAKAERPNSKTSGRRKQVTRGLLTKVSGPGAPATITIPLTESGLLLLLQYLLYYGILSMSSIINIVTSARTFALGKRVPVEGTPTPIKYRQAHKHVQSSLNDTSTKVEGPVLTRRGREDLKLRRVLEHCTRIHKLDPVITTIAGLWSLDLIVKKTIELRNDEMIKDTDGATRSEKIYNCLVKLGVVPDLIASCSIWFPRLCPSPLDQRVIRDNKLLMKPASVDQGTVAESRSTFEVRKSPRLAGLQPGPDLLQNQRDKRETDGHGPSESPPRSRRSRIDSDTERIPSFKSKDLVITTQARRSSTISARSGSLSGFFDKKALLPPESSNKGKTLLYKSSKDSPSRKAVVQDSEAEVRDLDKILKRASCLSSNTDWKR